jgi:hypothetical protein
MPFGRRAGGDIAGFIQLWKAGTCATWVLHPSPKIQPAGNMASPPSFLVLVHAHSSQRSGAPSSFVQKADWGEGQGGRRGPSARSAQGLGLTVTQGPRSKGEKNQAFTFPSLCLLVWSGFDGSLTPVLWVLGCSR